MMPSTTAHEVLDRCFLDVRSRILDIAAALDRMDRSSDAAGIRADVRLTQLRAALTLLVDGRPDRAERVQMVFSLPYQENWRGQAE